MLAGIDLDHVALAAERQTDLWPRYAGDLGGRWVQGGGTRGFTWGQVAYANGMKVEVLEPFAVAHNDFLRRFLDRSGPGAHHLTYKVSDIVAALDAAREAGYEPVSVNIANPWWKEAFLHPKSAPGIVIQLAQSAEPGDGGEGEEWEDDEEDWPEPPFSMPTARTTEPAALAMIVHAVRSLVDGRAMFAQLLGGEVTGEGTADGIEWIDLAWPGPGRVRLVAPTSSGAHLERWLGTRAGRLRELVFTTDNPAAIAGARRVAEGLYQVADIDNYGVGLLLSEQRDVSEFSSWGT